MTHTLSVAAIASGTVIDHIRAGAAMSIVQLLTPTLSSNSVLVAMNLKSQLMGRKDLIKLEERFLDEQEASLIALYAPEATVNIIRHYEVEEKRRISLPAWVEGLFQCPNAQCITRHEGIYTSCRLYDRPDEPLARCYYCERVFPLGEWERQQRAEVHCD